jgi:hypothetical protein
MINGRTTAMTVNEFDQLDRPLWTGIVVITAVTPHKPARE